MAREHEEVHSDGNDGGTDGDNEKFTSGAGSATDSVSPSLSVITEYDTSLLSSSAPIILTVAPSIGKAPPAVYARILILPSEVNIVIPPKIKKYFIYLLTL
jgi:hypothetical protein